MLLRMYHAARLHQPQPARGYWPVFSSGNKALCPPKMLQHNFNSSGGRVAIPERHSVSRDRVTAALRGLSTAPGPATAVCCNAEPREGELFARTGADLSDRTRLPPAPGHAPMQGWPGSLWNHPLQLWRREVQSHKATFCSRLSWQLLLCTPVASPWSRTRHPLLLAKPRNDVQALFHRPKPLLPQFSTCPTR